MKRIGLAEFTNYIQEGISSDISYEAIYEYISPVRRKERKYGRLNARSKHAGIIENIRSDLKIVNLYKDGVVYENQFSLPNGENKCIGACEDKENNGIIFFNYNSEGIHGIYRYLANYNAIEKILVQDKVEYPTFLTDLNFDVNNKIQSIKFNKYLIFTDDYNDIRQIDIDKCIDFTNKKNTYYSFITNEHITFIRKQPMFLWCEYYSDTEYPFNFLRGRCYQFKIRYIYIDSSRSATSPASIFPKSYQDELITNEYVDNIQQNNCIKIKFNTGAEVVKTIEIFVRMLPDGLWEYYDSVMKYDENDNLILPNNALHTYYFYDNKNHGIAIQEEILRNFNNVPLRAKTLDIVEGNRIVFGNCTVGFNNVKLDCTIEAVPKLVNFFTTYDVSSWIQYSSTDGSYIKINYLMTLNPNYHYTFFLKFVGTDSKEYTVPYYIPRGSFNYWYHALGRGLANSLAAYCTPEETILPGKAYYSTSDKAIYFNPTIPSGHLKSLHYQIMSVEKTQTHKKGGFAKYGIVYYDEYGRHGYVNTDESLEIKIPTNKSLKDDSAVGVKISINHEAPSWAKYYSIVYAYKRVDFIKFRATFEISPKYNGKIYNDRIGVRIHEYFSDYVKSRSAGIKIPTFEKGDIIKIYTKAVEHTYTTVISNPHLLGKDIFLEILDIIEDNGKTVYLVSEKDFANSGAEDNSLCEVIKRDSVVEQEQEIFYEIGKISTVTYRNGYYCHDAIGDDDVEQDKANNQPAEINIEGNDCYIKVRYDGTYLFPVEDPNYSEIYDSVCNDTGRINVVNPYSKQEKKIDMLIHGERYFDETMINYLNEFKLYDNTEFLGKNYGEITRIIFRGFTLKCFQENGLTSIYINKRMLYNADGSTSIVATDRVFAVINRSEISCGCVHPESISYNDRNIYFFDAIRGKTFRDSPNGLVAISDYGMINYHLELSEYIYKVTNEGYIREEPYKSYVVGVYDEYNNEYFFNAQITKKVLIGSSYSFETISETPVFHEPSNRWKYFKFDNDTLLDYVSKIGQTLVYWKDGVLYKAESGYDYGSFLDKKMDFYVTIATQCGFRARDKVFESIEVRTNDNNKDVKSWYANVYIPYSHLYGCSQASMIPKRYFIPKETGMYAEFLRDTNTPSNKDTMWRLINGRQLVGNVIEIQLINTANYYVYLHTIIVSGNESHSGY